MCCLKYEQEAYEELHKVTPRVDSLVQTAQGQGVVVDVGLLRGMLKVRLDTAPDTPPKWIHKDEVQVLRQGSPRRERGHAPDGDA
jgi:cell fate regulator YaaT (PSP1 superfamily)